jgi:hypothetical protein
MVQERRAHVETRQPVTRGSFGYQAQQFADGRRGARVPRSVRDSDQRWNYTCSPHSVLPVPAQRPLRGSEPDSTRLVQVRQPIDG